MVDNTSANNGTIENMLESIAILSNVFFKSQQRDEEDIDKSQKIEILRDLYQNKPNIFIERYHKFIEPKFISLFDENNPNQKFYMDHIKFQSEINAKQNQLKRNRRFLAMQELRMQGSYFSNEKMREREPYLFDIMVGQYLDDAEKIHLRPTVEIDDSNKSEFSKLLQQLDDTQRVSDRRKRYLDIYRAVIASDSTDRLLKHVDHRTLEADEEEIEFNMEFDSSDDEGMETERHRLIAKHSAARERKRGNELKSQDEEASEAMTSLQLSNNSDAVAKEWSSGDEDESYPTGLLRDHLHAEFVSMMEQRFLDGRDSEFFDYTSVDSGQGLNGNGTDRIHEQDLEDAYFDSEEPD